MSARWSAYFRTKEKAANFADCSAIVPAESRVQVSQAVAANGAPCTAAAANASASAEPDITDCCPKRTSAYAIAYRTSTARRTSTATQTDAEQGARTDSEVRKDDAHRTGDYGAQTDAKCAINRQHHIAQERATPCWRKCWRATGEIVSSRTRIGQQRAAQKYGWQIAATRQHAATHAIGQKWSRPGSTAQAG